MSHSSDGASFDKRPRVLCVDDNPEVLELLRQQLYANFAVVGVDSGEDALVLLAEDAGFPVLVCDMRMPGMDGVAVLAKARLIRPDTVRILLTGQADIDDTIGAINDGNVFRCLIKPCARDVLITAIKDAVELHRTISAERELLDQALTGSVAALLETLSLANPLAFARAARIRNIMRELIEAVNPPDPWSIEIASMLSQIGTVVLNPATLSKLNNGTPLSSEEELQVRASPSRAERLLEKIPRLEVVRRIIADQALPYSRTEKAARTTATLGAQMLRIVVDLEYLEAGGLLRRAALSTLNSREGSYDPSLLARLSDKLGPDDGAPQVLALSAGQLRSGLTIVTDVLDSEGRLLAGRGYVVTESFIARVSHLKGMATVCEPIYVMSELNGADLPTPGNEVFVS
jgi:CheY-like chemotaxis protein